MNYTDWIWSYLYETYLYFSSYMNSKSKDSINYDIIFPIFTHDGKLIDYKGNPYTYRKNLIYKLNKNANVYDRLYYDFYFKQIDKFEENIFNPIYSKLPKIITIKSPMYMHLSKLSCNKPFYTGPIEYQNIDNIYFKVINRETETIILTRQLFDNKYRDIIYTLLTNNNYIIKNDECSVYIILTHILNLMKIEYLVENHPIEFTKVSIYEPSDLKFIRPNYCSKCDNLIVNNIESKIYQKTGIKDLPKIIIRLKK